MKHELSKLSSRDRAAGTVILRWPFDEDVIQVLIIDSGEVLTARWNGRVYILKIE